MRRNNTPRKVIALIRSLEGWRLLAFIIVVDVILSVFINHLSYSKLWRLYDSMRLRGFERNGDLYDEVFHIRKWKEYIPAVGPFDKKSLPSHPDSRYFSAYLLENVRADLYHQANFIVFSLIILILPPPVKWRLGLWTFGFNVPCAMIQRFNRPRVEKALQRQLGSDNPELVMFWDDGCKAPLYLKEGHRHAQTSR